MRIEATENAQRAVGGVRDDGHSELVIVLGSGCCDSSAPYLYDRYVPEPDSERVGEIDGVPVLAPRWMADLYSGDATLVIDAEEGIVNDSLSLESEHDRRLVIRLPDRDPEG